MDVVLAPSHFCHLAIDGVCLDLIRGAGEDVGGVGSGQFATEIAAGGLVSHPAIDAAGNDDEALLVFRANGQRIHDLGSQAVEFAETSCIESAATVELLGPVHRLSLSCHVVPPINDLPS